MQTLPTVIQKAHECTISTNPGLSYPQMEQLIKLHSFAIYQAQNNTEVKHLPSKLTYTINQELKLAIVALLTTCSLLDYTRHGKETEDFFNKKIQIIQSNSKAKNIIFEDIRPYLLDNFLVPELVDDWITYRDCNGDSIYALMDKKTRLQRLETYSRGGDPVYEFARFYRKFMEDKIQKQDVLKQKMQDTALKSLTDALVQQQLEQGINPSEILNNLLSGDILTPQIESNKPLLLKKK